MCKIEHQAVLADLKAVRTELVEVSLGQPFDWLRVNGIILLLLCLGSSAFAQRSALKPAKSDPFAAFAPAAKVVKAKAIEPPTTPVNAPPVAAPLPTAPPLELVFAGRMTGADGQQQVFALHKNQMLTLQAGLMLPHGYRVDAIRADRVELSYPSLNATARLNLPEPPKFESR